MKKFAIYQLPYENLAKFMSLEFVKEHEIMPKFTDYKKVWEGEVEETGTELEDLFQKFNIGKRPEGYTGHSLSTSDVVMMDNRFYYCDSYGWEEIELPIRSKQMKYQWRDEEFTVTLTASMMLDIEHDVRIGKLNGRTLEQVIENAYIGIREWPEVFEEVWNNREYQPELGMGATMNLWSDRRAMTVTKVISPKKIEVTENETECLDFYASTYKILDTLAEYMGKTIFTLRKNGTWVQEGQPKKFGSVTLTLGFRHHYIDPSF